jgi:hypothetical protein
MNLKRSHLRKLRDPVKPTDAHRVQPPSRSPSRHPTNLANHHTFEPPPEGFMPLHASAEDLDRYGIIHRPDPRKTPQAARLWHRVMSRVKKFVIPQLTTRPDIIHGPTRNPHARAAGGTVHSPAQQTRPDWSGLVVTEQTPYDEVWGTWTIPMVQAPPGASGSFNSAVWVGLGGFVDKNLLQAGTEQDVDPKGNVNYYAWVEWFPGFNYQIQNFPIAPGQTIAVFVSSYIGGTGIYSMANLETGQALPLTVIDPPTPGSGYSGYQYPTSVSTTSAEWIVERPTLVAPDGQKVLSELADYGELNFTNAGVMINEENSGKTEIIPTISDSQAFELTMTADDNKTPLSEATMTPAVHLTFYQTTLIGPPGDPGFTQ